MCNITLSSQSSESQIKSYFNSVLTLSKSGEKFPIDLDNVWQICYAQKVKALQFLIESGQFYENEDYILLSQKVKQNGEISANVGSGGHNRQVYMLSVPCMEYLIARKVRAVFEVYRRVFHEFLNAKRMSEDEIVLQAMLIQQRRIEQKGMVAARQSKQLQKYKAQLEYKKQEKKLAGSKNLCENRKKDYISKWFADYSNVGQISLQELLVSFLSYYNGNIEALKVGRKDISKYLRAVGFEDVRNSSGMVFILTER